MERIVAVIILSFNEELHIQRAIESVRSIAKDIFVVDSFSTDNTTAIAEKLGAKIVQNKWEGHSRQFNWALQNLPIQTEWVLRLDADEYLTPELTDEIINKLPGIEKEVSGIILHRKQYCFGKWFHRLKLLRLFRYNKGFSERRWMDEHIYIKDGETVEFDNLFFDHNLNNFGWWTEKHNGYSIREAIDLLDLELNITGKNTSFVNIGNEAMKKRKKKLLYARSPLFWRAFVYFFYRYIIKLGFIHGKAGFIWHFFQGFWYRALVDAKIYEIKKACGNDKGAIIEYIIANYGIDCRNI